MRRFIAWAVIVIGNLLVLGLMLVLSSQEPAFYFKETFDDPTLLGWEHSPGVRVVNQVLRIEPGNAAFYPKSLGNLSLTIRARRLGNGALSVNYCAGDQGAYIFRFGDDSIVLIREQAAREEKLAAAPISIPPNTWVTVHIIYTEGNHVISLDGKRVLLAYDSHLLPPSGIFLVNTGEEGAVGEFDDLEMRGDEHEPYLP
ncbi:MAG: hypothetical protein JXB07_10985 [Anaerolineae bacterium]|nr:hypothetical protein [Anaerolineae bacterium]